MTQFRRIAYLFEGKEPVRIRLIDSGKAAAVLEKFIEVSNRPEENA